MEEDQGISKQLLIIGGSAGSLEVLSFLLPKLILPISYSIVIVIHRKHGSDDLLTGLLQNDCPLPVREAREKEEVRQGMVYLAPSDYHLLFEKNYSFSLDHSEKINYSRPSIDVSFESASHAFKENVLGLLLSGANQDGTTGLKQIRKMGGKIIVQDPESASFPYMPARAQQECLPDAVLAKEEMNLFIYNHFCNLSGDVKG
ncbi:MAG: chemotaxis protein CheB [Ginsengibacter sp.]